MHILKLLNKKKAKGKKNIFTIWKKPVVKMPLKRLFSKCRGKFLKTQIPEPCSLSMKSDLYKAGINGLYTGIFAKPLRWCCWWPRFGKPLLESKALAAKSGKYVSPSPQHPVEVISPLTCEHLWSPSQRAGLFVNGAGGGGGWSGGKKSYLPSLQAQGEFN